MKVTYSIGMFLAGVMGVSIVGCDGTPLLWGQCRTDEDLQTEVNYYEGAICGEDGYAVCPDGSKPCTYLKTQSDGKVDLVDGCKSSECLHCSPGQFLCIFWDDAYADGNTWVLCVDDILDCWAMDAVDASRL